ncbi:uncharacterized protein [Misgurnus anguillicaudatus]|uniref:uncharacterized protein n=1 Tax=Misgurnus anguillicaudatus TaxID=75329 RepID=UPI003CCF29F5
MHVLYCIFISALLKIADGFTVNEPSGPLVVPLGGSVVLPCSVGSPLPLEDLEVEWRRSDSQTLIHLYQDEDIRPEAQHQDYHDRAHFFTEDIKHGNFSLLLNNLTAEDEGQYTCKVYSGKESGETVVEIKHVERLIVSGSNKSISASVGDDITMNCSVDSHIKPEEIEEVSWRKTNKGEPITVLLYQNNETQSESSDEQYRDRVEFFTDEIHRGNFSLRLKRVRTEDKGVYICQVFTGELSANTTVILEQLGFSGLHVLVLILCITACVSALVFCSLIYHKLNITDTSRIVWYLHVSLVIFPNICVFFAFFIWGVIEGFLNETITCCALYILRIFMLFWAVPYLKYLQDNHTTWIKFSSIPRELSVFTIIVYSVFFEHAWKEFDEAIDIHPDIGPHVSLGINFGIVVLLSLIIIFLDLRFRVSITILVVILSLVQTIQLFSFAFEIKDVFMVYGVLGFMVFYILLLQILKAFQKIWKLPIGLWDILLWIIFTIILLDISLETYLHRKILENQTDLLGWICVMCFIEVLKRIVLFEHIFLEASLFLRGLEQQPTKAVVADKSLQGSRSWVLCNVIMYMFGAVGVVLLSSVALMVELILKARNGERMINDLRVIVFPSECVFASYWAVVLLHAFWKILKTDLVLNQKNSPEKHGIEGTEKNQMK